jgi:hypothetical protein
LLSSFIILDIILLMPQQKQLSWTKPLLLDEAVRAVICMLPMVIGMILGWGSISALGQGGFYYSYLPLPQKKGMRFIMSGLLITIGLGFYLMGGNVVFNPWLAIVYTFFVGMNLVFLGSWKMLGPLAFSFISIYAAGLNAGSLESVHSGFMAFVLSMGWAALISLLPIWKGSPASAKKSKEPTPGELVGVGLKMGIGTAVAELISQLLGFTKMGWATSGVGNVIRYDLTTSKLRAMLRMFGTFIGLVLLLISLRLTDNVIILASLTLVYAFINGLTKGTKLGQTIIFYTATIMTLYVLNDLSGAQELSIQRFMYNLIGVVIGVFVAMYPFPRLFNKLKEVTATTGEDVQT